MNWVDYAILGIIAISALISLVRGFAREVLSIIAWVAAFWAALRFAAVAAPLLEPYLASPNLRIGAAFVLIFVGVLLLGALINFLVSFFIGRTGLSGTDRAVGVVFGAAHGVLIVAVLVLLLGLTPIPRVTWWRQSQLISVLTPWVCQVGVDTWMRDFTVFSPLASGGIDTAVGKPVATYWSEFCAGNSAGEE